MSKLFGIGRTASDYVRRRMNRSTRKADRIIDQIPGSRRRATSLAQRLAQFVFGRDSEEDVEQRPGAPPVAPGFRPPAAEEAEEVFDEIQLLGRDATYHDDDWKVVMDGLRLTPGSSNVYGYYFEFESRTMGILYVTFRANGEGTGAGPSYAYYNVPAKKYHEFRRASEESAGGAVWDYLRVRESAWKHQHHYRLVDSATGYIPRKATRRGFAARALADRGIGRRSYRRNTLPAYNDGRPDRGRPDRGEPDRGR